MEPILKWAGGKRQLMPQLKTYITPTDLSGHTLIEPFVGGGSVFLALEHNSVVINDYNSELINVYNAVKSAPNELILELENHKKNHSTEYYYNIRELDRLPSFNNLSSVEKAARVIYLNRTCYNGLYRVNKNGHNNVPIGNYSNPDIVQATKILNLSTYLNNNDIRIMCGDFENATCEAKTGDIIYFDPPYDYESDGFTNYTANSFSRNDLIRMKSVCDNLINNGCTVVISNNDTHFVNDLFSGNCYLINHVSANRMINRDPSKRRNVSEVIIVGKQK